MAGATGWTGSALSHALRNSPKFELVNGLSRSKAGQDLGQVLEGRNWNVPLLDSVEMACADASIFIDYTSHNSVFSNVTEAIKSGAHVVIGSSGLSSSDFETIDKLAQEKNVGVIASGNFALTAALAQACSKLVAKHLPSWEIVDYAWAGKPDAPSGTARELAETLSALQKPTYALSPESSSGPEGARGADIDGTRVHSIRLPGVLHVGTDAVFGMKDERLIIKFEAADSPHPYVFGTLLAAELVSHHVGLIRGLDTLLFDI